MTRAALGARAVVRVAAATEAGRGVLGTAGQRNGRLATVGATRQAPRVVRARAEDPKKDVGGAEADEFLGGAVGKFISGLTEFAANSPINQGKIALAKAQAGDYDVEATQKELQEVIDGSKVVMFSFTT